MYAATNDNCTNQLNLVSLLVFHNLIRNIIGTIRSCAKRNIPIKSNVILDNIYSSVFIAFFIALALGTVHLGTLHLVYLSLFETSLLFLNNKSSHTKGDFGVFSHNQFIARVFSQYFIALSYSPFSKNLCPW